MSIFQSTTNTGLEAAIRARIAIDSRAAETVRELDRKLVRLCVDDNDYFILFADGNIRVSSQTDEVPDMTLTGSVMEIGRTLLSNQTGSVEIEGNESILEALRNIFRPSVNTGDFAEKARATAEYGVAAAKSALEGLASDLLSLKSEQEQLDEHADQIRELQRTLRDLEERIAALEGK